MTTEGIDVRSVGNTLTLHETALIEAFNLKAAIEYQLKNCTYFFNNFVYFVIVGDDSSFVKNRGVSDTMHSSGYSLVNLASQFIQIRQINVKNMLIHIFLSILLNEQLRVIHPDHEFIRK